jgi:hypothetical protein
VASSGELQLQSEAERFVESLQSAEASFEEPNGQKESLQADYDQCKGKVCSFASQFMMLGVDYSDSLLKRTCSSRLSSS